MYMESRSATIGSVFGQPVFPVVCTLDVEAYSEVRRSANMGIGGGGGGRGSPMVMVGGE